MQEEVAGMDGCVDSACAERLLRFISRGLMQLNPNQRALMISSLTDLMEENCFTA